MNRQELVKKYEKNSNKLKANEEFVIWNRNFNKKANKLIIKLLIISLIIALPAFVSIIPGVIITKELFKLGLYGIIGVSIVLVDSIIIKTALLANKLYLKSSQNKLITQKQEILKEIEILNSQNKTLTKTQNNNQLQNKKNINNNYSYIPGKYNSQNNSSITVNKSKKTKVKTIR